jgi:hypothetical protein
MLSSYAKPAGLVGRVFAACTVDIMTLATKASTRKHFMSISLMLLRRSACEIPDESRAVRRGNENSIDNASATGKVPALLPQLKPRAFLIVSYAALISRVRSSAISRMLSGSPLPASLSG